MKMEIYALIYAFPSQMKAGYAYDAIRNIIHTQACELSAYRLIVNDVWHVLVVGHTPSIVLATPLKSALNLFKGKETTMPTDVVEQFYLRHFQKTLGEGAIWNEQSYD